VIEVKLNLNEDDIEKYIGKALSSQFHKTTFAFLANNGYNAHFVKSLEASMDKAFKDIDITGLIKETCESTMKDMFREWLIKNSKDLQLFTDFYKQMNK